MDITTRAEDDLLELRLAGMLDNNSAAHVSAAIDDVVRRGSHRVVVNLAGVSYLSSAGIAVLLRAQKELTRIKGFFGVCDPSPAARDILRLTGLEKLLVCDLAAHREFPASAHRTTEPQFRVADREGLAFEVYDVAPGETLSCQAVGDPARLAGDGYLAADCRRVSLAPNLFGVGLGAFGTGFGECRPRFGEFLAAAGAAAQLPTHVATAPDYQLATGDFVPSIQVLYALFCEGTLAHVVRFEPSATAEGAATLSSVIDQSLALTESSLAGVVMVAETAGLIGAALRRSPAADDNGSAALYRFPAIRDWLSFTPEHAFAHGLALVTGVVARGEALAQPRLAPFLRPLGERRDLNGHFHAAVFSYQPLKKGRLDLATVVPALFESQKLEGVLHLLADERAISGAGESEFVRGACWIGPIANVVS